MPQEFELDIAWAAWTASALYLGGQNEKDRGYRKAVQARRGEGGAAGSWPAGYHRNRGQGFRPPERPHRTLSRRRICRGFPAEGQNRGRLLRRLRREGDRGDPQR